MTAKGQERFSLTGLRAGSGWRKETLAGIHPERQDPPIGLAPWVMCQILSYIPAAVGFAWVVAEMVSPMGAPEPQPIFGGPGRNCAPSASRPAPGTKFTPSLMQSGSSNNTE